MKKFEVLAMKIVIDCKEKNQNGVAYIISWWIETNLPLMTSKI